MLHGGELLKAARDYGIEPFKWLDLSTGINPNGYFIKDLPQSCFHHLPDPTDLMSLEATARETYSVPAGVGLIAAAGSEALIQTLPQIFPTMKVAIVSPTFSSHEAAWRRYGHDVHLVDSLDEIGDATIVVVVNPNNPDGKIIKPKVFKKLAETLKAKGGALVVDEAFADCSLGTSFVPLHDNSSVIVLRSIGKFFGLAGLRLGFAIGPERYLERLKEIMGDWAVSGPAIEIGRKALGDHEWIEKSLQLLELQTKMHRAMYERVSLKVVGGTLLFNLIEVPDARTVHHELARRAIWTRRFDYNPHWLRIGLCKSQSDLKQFENALVDVLETVQQPV